MEINRKLILEKMHKECDEDNIMKKNVYKRILKMNNVKNFRTIPKIKLIYIINDIFILAEKRRSVQTFHYSLLKIDIKKGKKYKSDEYIKFINTYIEKYINDFYISYIALKVEDRKIQRDIFKKEDMGKKIKYNWKNTCKKNVSHEEIEQYKMNKNKK